MKKCLKYFVLAIMILLCFSFLIACDDSGDDIVLPESKGTFYGIEYAYEYDFINKDDVKSIAYYYNNEATEEDNFVPTSTISDGLSEEIIEDIKSTKANEINKTIKWKKNKLTTSDIDVRYLGTYNGYIAVEIKRNDKKLSKEKIEEVWGAKIVVSTVEHNKSIELLIWEPINNEHVTIDDDRGCDFWVKNDIDKSEISVGEDLDVKCHLFYHNDSLFREMNGATKMFVKEGKVTVNGTSIMTSSNSLIELKDYDFEDIRKNSIGDINQKYRDKYFVNILEYVENLIVPSNLFTEEYGFVEYGFEIDSYLVGARGIFYYVVKDETVYITKKIEEVITLASLDYTEYEITYPEYLSTANSFVEMVTSTEELGSLLSLNSNIVVDSSEWAAFDDSFFESNCLIVCYINDTRRCEYSVDSITNLNDTISLYMKYKGYEILEAGKIYTDLVVASISKASVGDISEISKYSYYKK